MCTRVRANWLVVTCACRTLESRVDGFYTQSNACNLPFSHSNIENIVGFSSRAQWGRLCQKQKVIASERQQQTRTIRMKTHETKRQIHRQKTIIIWDFQNQTSSSTAQQCTNATLFKIEVWLFDKLVQIGVLVSLCTEHTFCTCAVWAVRCLAGPRDLLLGRRFVFSACRTHWVLMIALRAAYKVSQTRVDCGDRTGTHNLFIVLSNAFLCLLE